MVQKMPPATPAKFLSGQFSTKTEPTKKKKNKPRSNAGAYERTRRQVFGIK